MAKRLITGLILAPLIVLVVLYAPKPVFFTLLTLAAAQGIDELVRMFPEMRRQDRVILAALAALLTVETAILGKLGLYLGVGVLPIIWISLCLLRPGTVEDGARRAGTGLLGLSYVATLVAVVAVIFVRQDQPPGSPFDTGRGATLGLLIIVFCGDTGAYFAGRALGKHKLYELISPKKTLEGAIGGLLASILGGWITMRLLLPQLGLLEALLLGATCGAVGQIGDLAESLFKRATGTKDSGGLLPGHGGILDRLDGVLFAAPVLLLWLILR